MPYSWETFGPQEYFGQDVYAWAYIDECPFTPEAKDVESKEFKELTNELAKEFVAMMIDASVDELMKKNENLTKEMEENNVKNK